MPSEEGDGLVRQPHIFFQYMDILPWFPDQNLYTRRWDESWHRPIQEIARDLKSTLM